MKQRWYGKAIGFCLGLALSRGNPWVALVGLFIGHAADTDWFKLRGDDPYAALGVDREASDAEIDKAYRRLISQYHPDRYANDPADARQHAEAKAREINRAYDRIRRLRRGRT